MPGKRVGRLPTLGETPAEPAPEPDAAAVVAEDAGQGPALDRFARPFDGTDSRPRLAVVLIDDGASPMDPATLQALPFPVSIAIDATRADAADLMRAYRAAGQEVLAMAPLPAGAEPTDVAVAIDGYLTALPETVAVIEAVPGGLQPGRPQIEQLVASLGRSGHGLVSYQSGLNSASKIAAREGLPAAEVYRVIDDKSQSEAAIRRLADQAAFRAGQTGGVVLVGHLRPETLAALAAWSTSPRAATIVLTPVSVVLKGE
ncbi:divergent polysaccharide deacetylase family protein [Frigidibacter sp. SLM-1]|nr:divergent polysaccharide deacetylase family protein [Frigidibacter sp. ROC022]